MTIRPTCIWIWSIWNDYFPCDTICTVTRHELLFTGEIWVTVISRQHINNTHTKFITSFRSSMCLVHPGVKTGCLLLENARGEKREKAWEKNKEGMATFSRICASKSLWQFRKFSCHAYTAWSSAGVVLQSSMWLSAKVHPPRMRPLSFKGRRLAIIWSPVWHN